MTPKQLQDKVAEFLAAHDPATTDRLDFLRARYDAGLARVHPPGRSGRPRAPAGSAGGGGPALRRVGFVQRFRFLPPLPNSGSESTDSRA